MPLIYQQYIILCIFCPTVQLCDGSAAEPDQESVHVGLWARAPVHHPHGRGQTPSCRRWVPWHRQIRLSECSQKQGE